MLLLCSVGAGLVDEGRVGVDDALADQLAQEAVELVQAVVCEEALAERQRVVGLVDVRQQLLGACAAEGHVGGVVVFHVVGALAVLDDLGAAAHRAKRLDGVKLALLHLGLGAASHQRHALAGVDAVAPDGVAVEVLDGLDLVRLAVQLHLKGLHGFLDGSAHVAQAHVHAGLADAGGRGLLDGLHQGLKARLEGHGPGAVDDVAVDLGAKVHLHHVALREEHVLPGVGRVVGGHVVQAAAGGKGDATLQPVGLDQLAVQGLHLLAHGAQVHARLDDALPIGPHVAMHLCRLARDVVGAVQQPLPVPQLLAGLPELLVLSSVAKLLSHGVHVVLPQVHDRDGGRVALLPAQHRVAIAACALREQSSSLFLLLLLLLLLALLLLPVSLGCLRRLLLLLLLLFFLHHFLLTHRMRSLLIESTKRPPAGGAYGGHDARRSALGATHILPV